MPELFDLKDKLCLVTGGSRGLGYGMARALGNAGARVAITARKSDELEQARSRLTTEGIKIISYVHDLADVERAPSVVAAIVEEMGPIDVLVNNAGTTWGGPAADLEWRGWKKVVDVNLNGTWAMTQAVATKCMISRKTGSIVIIASVAGLGGRARNDVPTVAYNTTKAAEINLARTLAAEWGAYGIRVNSILPGWFITKMARQTIDDHHETYLERIPLARFGDPDEDLNGPILFLASNASRYVTGHSLVVDGGLTSLI